MGLFKDKRFVLSCGKTPNSYGFVIPSEGVNMSRFESNPVMLDSHKRENSNVIGAWKNTAVDLKTDRITALPDFDTEDEASNLIAGKVKRGYIRAASIGISFKRTDLKMVNGVLTLTKCELLEASICAIPSNSSAVIVFEDGKQLSEQEVQEMCLSLSNNPNGKTPNTKINGKMEKPTIQLSLTALAVLGFEATQVETLQMSDINTAVLKLHKERDDAQTKVLAFEKKEKDAEAAEKTRLELRNETLVNDAIKAGKITAEEKDHYLKMAAFDFGMAEKQLGVSAGKTKFGKDTNPITVATLKMEDFQKMDVAAQLQWKEENPEGYKLLVG